MFCIDYWEVSDGKTNSDISKMAAVVTSSSFRVSWKSKKEVSEPYGVMRCFVETIEKCLMAKKCRKNTIFPRWPPWWRHHSASILSSNVGMQFRRTRKPTYHLHCVTFLSLARFLCLRLLSLLSDSGLYIRRKPRPPNGGNFSLFVHRKSATKNKINSSFCYHLRW